jgi:outer membrane lipoprotein-sorting protein
VKPLRALSTTRLLILAVAVAALAAAAGAIAVAASGGSGSTPPPKPLARALHGSLSGQAPVGVTARIKFTNKLFPSGAVTGQVGSALMSGASGRLWATNDGRGRLELQSNAGDVQIVWNSTDVSIFDASSNTVYRAKLPAQKNDGKDSNDAKDSGPAVPTVAQISDFLAKVGEHVAVSGAEPSNVGGQQAYTVRVSPKHDGGLLGAAELAWDASRGVPLRIAVYAQGASSPVLELAATEISYGHVPASDVEVAPPASATVVDLGALGKHAHGANGTPGVHASGLPAVQRAVDFTVVAPDSLVGLPRQDVRLVGSADSQAALAVYGHGLGAIVVIERKADATAGGGVMAGLPEVSLDGVTAHELSTQLGTALTWKRDGTSFVLAGSLPSAAAEAAARALK